MAKILTDDDVKNAAKLAMIYLTPDEIQKFKIQITSILEYVDSLNEVNTDNVDVKSHVNLTNVLREDIASESLDQEKVIDQTNHKNGYVLVPTVIEEIDG